MKSKFIMIMFFILLLIPFSSASENLGSSCGMAHPSEPAKVLECEKQTEFILWSRILSKSSDFVMKGVEDSTLAYDWFEIDSDGFKSNGLDRMMKFMLILGNSLVLLVLVLSGYMWITSSADPKKRDKAKSYLTNAIYMIIFINFGFLIANIALDVSTETSYFLQDEIGDDFFNTQPWNNITNKVDEKDLEGNYNVFSSIVTTAPVLFISGGLYISSMYFRNIIIVLLMILSPIIILLFFFEPTKSFGKILAILYGIELFLPLMFFPLFRICNLMISGKDNEISIMIIAATLMVAVAIHVIVVSVAILKSIRGGN